MTSTAKLPAARMIRTAPYTVALALVLTLTTIVLGYILLGALPMVLFSFGFLGGFVTWLSIPSAATYPAIGNPYFLTLGFFVLHKLEERYFDFFPALSEITGVPVPETDSFLVVALYSCAATWLLVPYLVSRGHQFGYYLAWTFFMSMGITELAHFIFPLLIDRPYGYFPGMLSVIVLAPAAWWGMWRLARG